MLETPLALLNLRSNFLMWRSMKSNASPNSSMVIFDMDRSLTEYELWFSAIRPSMRSKMASRIRLLCSNLWLIVVAMMVYYLVVEPVYAPYGFVFRACLLLYLRVSLRVCLSQ